MAGRPSGAVSFVFTDIEGSTRLWEEQPELMRVALARHDELLRRAIDAFDGYVFSTGGDGLGVSFHKPGDALGAAIEAQRSLLAEPWPEAAVLRVRIGIHSGEAEERDGDYFGPVVNRAARLMATGVGGQVLVSGATAGLVTVDPGVELVDLGLHRFRGLSEPTRVFGVRADGLTWTDRPLASEMIGNLPVPATAWFGRRDALAAWAEALGDRRAVTLTGAGGVGKSRLAVEMARLTSHAFADGVWLVELAPVGDPDAVVSVIAATMSIRVEEGMNLAASIVEFLRSRQLLLILDNCEHVVTAVSMLVENIVARCPNVRVLATSREPLALDGERLYRVPSMTVDDAVDLFCDRAATNDAPSEVSGDRATIAAICERLDGIPLAIELAAARMRALSPAEVLARLHDRFRLLRGGGGRLERHQTLRAAVAWSYELLGDRERTLFDRLSVFAGTFDLPAIESVCATDELDRVDVVDVMSSLVDKSMVSARRDEAAMSYSVLETLRQYGEERLADSGEIARWRERHFEHYLESATYANRLLQTARELDGVARFQRDWANLRAAHSWTIGTQDLHRAGELLAATTMYAGLWSQPELGEWAERTLALDVHHDAPPDLYGIAAHWAYVTGDPHRARTLAREGIRRATSDDAPGTAWCWLVVTSSRAPDDDPAFLAQAARHFETAARAARLPVGVVLALSRQAVHAAQTSPASVPNLLASLDHEAAAAGSISCIAAAASTRGRVALATGDPATALDCFHRVYDLTQPHGMENYQASAVGIAIAQSLLNDPTADASFADALTITATGRNWGHLWRALRAVAHHFVRTQRHEPATAILGHLAAHDRHDRFPGDPALDTSFVDNHPNASSWAASGAAMNRDQIVQYTLDQLTPAPLPASKAERDSRAP